MTPVVIILAPGVIPFGPHWDDPKLGWTMNIKAISHIAIQKMIKLSAIDLGVTEVTATPKVIV